MQDIHEPIVDHEPHEVYYGSTCKDLLSRRQAHWTRLEHPEPDDLIQAKIMLYISDDELCAIHLRS